MLDDKIALVTGSSSGIGRATAIALAKEGADVVVTYFRNEKGCRETTTAIEALGRQALALPVNLAYPEEIDRLFQLIKQRVGHLDIFVSNAASTTFKPLAELAERHWDYILNVNLNAFFFCSLRAAVLMEGRSGHIIAISSLGSEKYFPGYGALGVAKAGMETLARYLAVEWAQRGINVNVVSGGPVESEALNALARSSGNFIDFKQLMIDRAPEKRLGSPEDMANAVLFLCSPAANWIRGQTIVVDGGISLV